MYLRRSVRLLNTVNRKTFHAYLRLQEQLINHFGLLFKPSIRFSSRDKSFAGNSCLRNRKILPHENFYRYYPILFSQSFLFVCFFEKSSLMFIYLIQAKTILNFLKRSLEHMQLFHSFIICVSAT